MGEVLAVVVLEKDHETTISRIRMPDSVSWTFYCSKVPKKLCW